MNDGHVLWGGWETESGYWLRGAVSGGWGQGKQAGDREPAKQTRTPCAVGA